METQATQILSLEAALLARPQLPPDAPENDKDRLLNEQAKTIRELEIVVKGYEDNLGEPLRAVREDVEKEWAVKLAAETRLREEKEEWANELVKQLEKERKASIPSVIYTSRAADSTVYRLVKSWRRNAKPLRPLSRSLTP